MIPNAINDRLRTDNRGVSPVIGVILMVAITVILAAVIGTFVLDLGQSAGNSAPSASLTVDPDASNEEITISHKGGDGIVGSQTRVTVTNESASSTLTFEPNVDDVYSVGGELTLDVDANPATISSGAWSATDESTSGNFTGVASGTQYTVQVIDLDSQRVIFETTVTA